MSLSSELLRELGYNNSQNWKDASEIGAAEARQFYLNSDERIVGAYTIQTSPESDNILPALPVVFVAKAQTESEARDIHRKLWNLGKVPFLLVVLSGQVRAYTGFDYDDKDKEAGLLFSSVALDAIEQGLQAFKAHQIDSGQIWASHGKKLKSEKRVDQRLLGYLQKLGTILTEEKGLSLSTAHALIGKYIYIRYLCDRNILSRQWLENEKRQIDIDKVLGRDATAKELLRLISALDERFNGQVFPLGEGENELTDDIVRAVASAFKGDDPSGQLALDFQIFDFSYIPVELLSSIYEQFLHRTGEGKKVGAYYTPEPVADYLLCEINSVKPLRKGMKVFDPCCGSGIFLVLAYRRLIEMELGDSSTGKLRSVELRDILQQSIFGVERNLEACYVTEFSLLLTLLSYVDPPELHRNTQFRFPELHNNNIHQSDFFDDAMPFCQESRKFDWVVGNPPWFELDPVPTDKPDPESYVREWIRANTTRKVARNRVCEAFTWRVGEFLSEDGAAGLLTHATSLTNDQSKPYRKAFFQQHQVRRITNFSHFAYILFKGRAKTPAATLIYTKAQDGGDKANIIHYAPFPVNQPQIIQGDQNDSWAITICENEIQSIESADAERGHALTWKLALWGSYRDKRVLERSSRLFPFTLGKLIEERKWALNAGLQVRDESSQQTEAGGTKKIESEPALKGMKVLNVGKLNRFAPTLTIPQEALDDLPDSMCNIRKGRREGLKIAYGPHILISPEYTAYSDADFVILNPRIGLAAPSNDREFLWAVSLLLNSSIIKYLLFFGSSSWGIDRTKIVPKDVLEIPFPLLSETQIIAFSNLHQKLGKIEESNVNNEDRSRQQIDKEIEQILKIPRNMALIAREFVDVRLQFNQGKTKGTAAMRPSPSALEVYARTLRDELDEFAEIHHRITLQTSDKWILCVVDATTETQKIEPVIEAAKSGTKYQAIWKQLQEQFSQWVYVQRSLRHFNGAEFSILKAARLIDWTQTQALYDSDDIIAEVLSQREVTT